VLISALAGSRINGRFLKREHSAQLKRLARVRPARLPSARRTDAPNAGGLHKHATPTYSPRVVANSTAGCGSPFKQKAHVRHRSFAGAFFVPAICYGGCAREGFGPAGFLLPRSSTPAYSRHHSCGSDVGDSSAKGALPMTDRLASLPPLEAGGLHKRATPTYSPRAVANSSAGLGRPIISRRTGAHHPIAGAFFTPARSCYGGCARDSFGGAGCLESRSANLRTVATLICLAANRGSSQLQELYP